jgi:hypothetical protein
VWLRLGNMTAAVLLAWPDDTIGEKRARIEASLVAPAFFMRAFRCLQWHRWRHPLTSLSRNENK